ncbi:MAG: 50S ribosomal protein L23 [Elusimicrobia bacterium CG11_big_fil_rev_8_21_14_0_20_64_6]|nr:MAG: 50S ribosomal protein L23 [Elusimicrobia bacterium CG11_big_fil_rev_8_21_14_0_20_64_6]
MSDKALHEILVRPLLTERGTGNQEKFNQYLFEAAPDATKTDIKRAVETMFKVEVEKIRTQIVPGKFRRVGRGGGMRPDWKKAIVTVAKGQKIDFATPAA